MKFEAHLFLLMGRVVNKFEILKEFKIWKIKEMKNLADNASTLPTKMYSFNGIECFR